MKVLYLIDSKKYNYHKEIIKNFTGVIPGDVLDMSDGTDFGTRYNQIKYIHPDVVITFDLAGHMLRTGSDNLSLNNIYSRMAHILFHKTDYYGQDLKVRQNLSMFTYVPFGEDMTGFAYHFPDVPNISEFVNIKYKPYSEDEYIENRKNIELWWTEFIKEAML